MMGCYSLSAVSLLDPTGHKHDDTTVSRNVGKKLTGLNFPENHNLQKHCNESLNCLCFCLFRGGKWSWSNRGTKWCPVMYGLRTEVRNGDFRNITQDRRVQSRVRSRYCTSHCVTRCWMESTRSLLWDTIQQTSCNEVYRLLLRIFYSFYALRPVDSSNW